jgi:hypothetical protein
MNAELGELVAMQDGYVELALKAGFVPVAHITLTFGKERQMVTPERAAFTWRQLVRRLNEHVGGRSYRRKWGHSYFGYVFGVERHKDGVPHGHAVVDNWIDFDLAHKWWNRVAGWMWIRRVDDDPLAAVRYVLKYVVKDDLRPSYWFQPEKRRVEPLTGQVFRATPRP